MLSREESFFGHFRRACGMEHPARFLKALSVRKFRVQREIVRRSGGLMDEAMVDGVEREFEAVGNAELVENVVQVILDRLLADKKLFADFLVAETLRDELHDFFFAVAE